MHPSFWEALGKRRRWLLCPDDRGDEEAFREWLPTPEHGRQAGSGVVDITCLASVAHFGNCAAAVFESLGEYENALVAANAQANEQPHLPEHQIEANATRMRCFAHLGRMTEAKEAYNAATKMARRIGLGLVEVFLRRDFIVNVLDPNGQRQEHVAALGGSLSRLVGDSSQYTAMLGAGLDSNVSLEAFLEQLIGANPNPTATAARIESEAAAAAAAAAAAVAAEAEAQAEAEAEVGWSGATPGTSTRRLALTG